MMKVYRLENLGCANCAAKMERKISGLKEVKEASVNFFSGKMMIELKDDFVSLGEDMSLDDLIAGLEKEVEKIIKKIEPQVVMKKV